MSTLALPVSDVRARDAAVPFAGRGWRTYLVFAALLVPFVIPKGPAQLALIDVLNFGALFAFAGTVIVRRPTVALPFLVPMLFIVTGSLLALTNAVSLGAGALALVQDAYLYTWLVVLIAVMSRQGDLVGFRVAWLAASNVAALVVLVQATLAGAFPFGLLEAEGFRPEGTFYGANMCADYLLLTVFIGVTLWGRVNRPFLVLSIGLAGLGILVTKSNGTIGALVVGALAAAVVLTSKKRALRLRTAGLVAILSGVVLFASWAFEQSGSADSLARSGRATILGRMYKSTPGRLEIWSQLVSQIQRRPLGIGPGNSVFQMVPIGHRERSKPSFQSKEAHSDYVGYATERGPIGLVGQLLWIVGGITLVLGGANARRFGNRETLVRAALVGGLVGSAVHSLVIEKLHFRHYWLFLALACAMAAGERFRGEARS